MTVSSPITRLADARQERRLGEGRVAWGDGERLSGHAPSVRGPVPCTPAVASPCDDDAVGVAPVELDRPESESITDPDRPWITLVWNDPVNLMSYVTYVFMEYFGYSKEKAQKLMWDVHHEGRAVVSNGTREEMEIDVAAMHSYGLWATLQKDD